MSTRQSAPRSVLRTATRVVVATSLAAAALLVPATTPDAVAAGRVTVTDGQGRAQADPVYSTTLDIRGTGFQSVQGAFGGIYVFFGWVSDPSGGSWGPSRGGHTGSEYRYVPDSEQADNEGFQRFVAFPGSETEYAANGGVIAADGTWLTKIVVPGPTFQSLDRSGKAVTVDCLAVQCGIITVGAHGVPNANNESFTPVTFAAGAGAGAGTGSAAPAPADGTATGTATGTEAPAAAGAPAGQLPAAPATLGVDQATAVAGRALSFVAQGFTPGEQVVGVLDDGVLAVGPFTAGNQGEVAGLLELPRDLRVGTHVLRLTGAGSGLAPEVEVTVRRDPADVAAAEAREEAATSPGGYSAAEIALGVAALVLLAVVISSFVTARRRRAAAGRGPDTGNVAEEAAPPYVPTWEPLPDETRPPDAPTQPLPAVEAAGAHELAGRHA